MASTRAQCVATRAPQVKEIKQEDEIHVPTELFPEGPEDMTTRNSTFNIAYVSTSSLTLNASSQSLETY